MRWWWPVPVVLIAACSSAHPAGCTLIGATGGVMVEGVGQSGDTVTGCLDSVCGPALVLPGGVMIESATVTHGRQTVTIRLTDATGAVLAGGAVSVDPATVTPNGPDCDPAVYQARVRVEPDGTLVEVR